MNPSRYILPVEIIYRELSQPQPHKRTPHLKDVATPELTRADVDDIIHRQRSATPDELQFVIDNAKRFKLTDVERNQLCVDLTLALSQRSRMMNGKREDVSARLISDLGYAQTPCGLLADRSWYQDQLLAGTKAIAACQRHLPPQCACWRSIRESLYGIRSSFTDTTPEGWAALRVWESLEEIELSSRPERVPVPVVAPPPIDREWRAKWRVGED
jgi:hypothetical protein